MKADVEAKTTTSGGDPAEKALMEEFSSYLAIVSEKALEPQDHQFREFLGKTESLLSQFIAQSRGVQKQSDHAFSVVFWCLGSVSVLLVVTIGLLILLLMK